MSGGSRLDHAETRSVSLYPMKFVLIQSKSSFWLKCFVVLLNLDSNTAIYNTWLW